MYDITISSVMAGELFGNCHMYPERYDMNRFAMRGLSIPSLLLEIKQNEGKSKCIYSFSEVAREAFIWEHKSRSSNLMSIPSVLKRVFLCRPSALLFCLKIA